MLAVWRSPLLAAFAPILWLFAVSTESIAFIVCFAIILAIVAVRFAFRPFHGAVEKGIAASAIGFKIWFVVFLVVALQTVTLIRPMRPTSVAKDAPFVIDTIESRIPIPMYGGLPIGPVEPPPDFLPPCVVTTLDGGNPIRANRRIA